MLDFFFVPFHTRFWSLLQTLNHIFCAWLLREYGTAVALELTTLGQLIHKIKAAKDAVFCSAKFLILRNDLWFPSTSLNRVLIVCHTV